MKENFRDPVLAVSVPDFWNRWHITFSHWLRDYIYMPITRAMLGVLDHDDHIDPGAALSALGLSLTPLNAALRSCLGDQSPTD